MPRRDSQGRFVKGDSVLGGIPEMKIALGRIKQQHEQQFEGGMKKAGLLLLRMSLLIVPVDKNFLRLSGKSIPTGSGFKVVVRVSYGTDYAIFVHEDLDAQHKPGKEAKFLEKPLRENVQRIVDIVADEIK